MFLSSSHRAQIVTVKTRALRLLVLIRRRAVTRWRMLGERSRLGLLEMLVRRIIVVLIECGMLGVSSVVLLRVR